MVNMPSKKGKSQKLRGKNVPIKPTQDFEKVGSKNRSGRGTRALLQKNALGGRRRKAFSEIEERGGRVRRERSRSKSCRRAGAALRSMRQGGEHVVRQMRGGKTRHRKKGGKDVRCDRNLGYSIKRGGTPILGR